MLTLINTNRMQPPIAPLGMAYVAATARRAGVDVEVLDPCMADDPPAAIEGHFPGREPALVGLSFRNLDDSFWPSARWFVPDLAEQIAAVRRLTDAPIVLGGVGYSIHAERTVEAVGADIGIRGDGEEATIRLYRELTSGRRRFENVPGLIWRPDCDGARSNPPAWPDRVSLSTARNVLDNAAYFRRGGQGGVETKRGCPRRCVYCADPLSKGGRVRPRGPAEVADEFESLAAQGVGVVHVCDGEFNVPREHALAVCGEMIRRGLGERVRWYAYMAVTPFDSELAAAMRRAGCVGIDFTGDAGCDAMLAGYGHPHRRADLAEAVRLCRENGIECMVDLLLGGPGETRDTAAESVAFLKRIGPDCVGAGVGMRVYAGTPAEGMIRAEGPLEDNPSIRRRYEGPVDLFRPTFYISHAMGPAPAAMIRDRIDGDPRFFEPADEEDLARGHNYNDNTSLVRAIARGERGAYWSILRGMRD